MTSLKQDQIVHIRTQPPMEKAIQLPLTINQRKTTEETEITTISDHQETTHMIRNHQMAKDHQETLPMIRNHQVVKNDKHLTTSDLKIMVVEDLPRKTDGNMIEAMISLTTINQHFLMMKYTHSQRLLCIILTMDQAHNRKFHQEEDQDPPIRQTSKKVKSLDLLDSLVFVEHMAQCLNVITVTEELSKNKLVQANHSASKEIELLQLLAVALAETGEWIVMNATLRKVALNARWVPGYLVATASRRCGDLIT